MNRNKITKFAYGISYLVIAYLIIRYVFIKFVKGTLISDMLYLFKDGFKLPIFLLLTILIALSNTGMILTDETWRAIFCFTALLFAVLSVVIFMHIINLSIITIGNGNFVQIFILMIFIIILLGGFSVLLGFATKKAIDNAKKHDRPAGKYFAFLIPIGFTIIIWTIIRLIAPKIAIPFAALTFCIIMTAFILFNWHDSSLNINTLIKSESPFLKKFVHDNTKSMLIGFSLIVIFLIVGVSFCLTNPSFKSIFKGILSLVGAILLGLIYAFNLSLAVIAPFALIVLSIFEKLIVSNFKENGADILNTWSPVGTVLLDFSQLITPPPSSGFYKTFGAKNTNMFMTS